MIFRLIIRLTILTSLIQQLFKNSDKGVEYISCAFLINGVLDAVVVFWRHWIKVVAFRELINYFKEILEMYGDWWLQSCDVTCGRFRQGLGDLNSFRPSGAYMRQ